MKKDSTPHRIIRRLFPVSGLLSLAALLILVLPAHAQEYKAFSVLGTSEAVCKPGIETATELQAFFANDRETVNEILQDANWQGDANLLFEAIAAGNFSERLYPKGSKFDWTGAKKKGKGKALPNRIWAGEEPFRGFETTIISGCNAHQIVIPHACCNVSLASVTPIDVPAPNVQIESDNENVTICADSGVQAVITDSAGNNRTVPLSADGCWTGRVSAGDIKVAVVNENECGVAASDLAHFVTATPAPAPTVAAAAPTPDLAPRTMIPFIGAFAGGETRMRYEPDWDKYYEDYADVIGVKAGALFPLSDSLSWFAQLGYLDRDGVSERLVYSDDTFFADVGLERQLGAGFVGGGVGLWNFADSEYDDISVFLHGGFGVTDRLQLIVEGRVFGEDLDDIDRNNLVTGGIRYLFK